MTYNSFIVFLNKCLNSYHIKQNCGKITVYEILSLIVITKLISISIKVRQK